MTVSASFGSVSYIGDGVTKSFSYPYKFFDEDLKVYKNKTFSTFEKNVDYTVAGSGNNGGGSVNFAVAPEAGMVITIVRDVPLHQQVCFIEGEEFPAADYEYSLDRIIMALQEIYQKAAQCIQMPPGGDGFEQFVRKLVKIDYSGDGASHWQEKNAYDAGELVRYHGYWWISLKTDNEGNEPMSKSAYWEKFAVQDAYGTEELDALLADKADVDAVYTKSETDAKIAAVPTVIKKENAGSVGRLWIVIAETDEYYKEGYRYYVQLEVDDATEAMTPTVVFNIEDAMSGNYAPVAEAGNGWVKVFAKEKPAEELVVPVIVLQ